MFNGILWIMKTGASRRDLPNEFGPWQTVYKRLSKWAKLSVWDDLFSSLTNDSDNESIMIDSSYVKLYQHGCGAEGGQYFQSIGRSRGGLTTKIHAVVDGLGNPVRIKLTSGNVHDSVPSCELIAEFQATTFLLIRPMIPTSLLTRPNQTIVTLSYRQDRTGVSNEALISMFTRSDI